MNTPLEQRVAKMEKSLRVYRLGFLVLLVIAAGLNTMSFKDKKPNVPDVLQAKAFQVVDNNGNVIVELNRKMAMARSARSLPVAEKLASIFTTDGGAGGINTYDNDGDVIFKVTNTIGGGGYLALFNSNVKEVAELGVTNAESGYFKINDRNADKLAWITYTENGGGYFSLSNNNKEYFRLSTPDVGGRLGIYNSSNTRIAYMGTQENKDGNVTVWNYNGNRTGGLPQ